MATIGMTVLLLMRKTALKCPSERIPRGDKEGIYNPAGIVQVAV
jgi:hypothetical protein